MAGAGRKVCVSVSGGIESAAMLAGAIALGAKVWPVYVRGGHAWEGTEVFWLKRLLRRLRHPRLNALSQLELPVRDAYTHARWSLTGRGVPSSSSRDEAVYLPGRNILLLSKIAVFCAERGIGTISLGTLGSNPFPDSSLRFFRLMGRAVSEGLDAAIRVEAPFRRLDKPKVIRKYRSLPWELTFSCIAPKGRAHCGRCNKCAERKDAFRRAGLPDPTSYRT
ncbi:MAG: 7-cyano-7-deazaguanine synthase [Elusimicrobia bacterium]|nr:7-cyano-7-deazaguanine synthase [Elusimicrobiota bacterium]